MFTQALSRHASNVLVRDGKGELTYRDALALGEGLTKDLPRARSLVFLRCAVTRETVAAYLALLERGHAPLLLESSLSADLMSGLVGRYDPAAIVDPQAGVVERRSAGATELHPDLALLLTTSGSTGSPKLVRLSRKGVHANASAVAESLALTSEERALLHLPLSYSYGLSVLHSHVLAGASVCLTGRTVMEQGYWDDLARHQATSMAGVPFHYMAIQRLGAAKLDQPSLRTLTQAGGRLDPRIVARIASWCDAGDRRFVVMYGQTEAGPRIAALPPELTAAKPASIGRPLPGITIDLVDEDGASVRDGSPGEIVVHSAGVMMGYAQAPDDLARGDELKGILHTGDVATRDAEGLLHIVGRRSRLLKMFGLRLNLDEVEQRLVGRGLPVVCFGEDDKLRVLLEGDGDAPEARQAIIDLFSLPPRSIEVRRVPILDRSSSGKLTADALAAAWESAS